MADEYRILLAKRVARDLESIFERIAKASPDNAARVVARILDAIETLKSFPHRNVVGDQSPVVKFPVRSMPGQSWMIFFRVIEQPPHVRILRVRHGARRRLKRY